MKDKRIEELRERLQMLLARLDEVRTAQQYINSNYFWVRIRQIEYLIDDILDQL